MSRLTVISQDWQREFCAICRSGVQASTCPWRREFHQNRPREISRLVPRLDIIGGSLPPDALAAMQQIIDMEVRQLFNLLKQETPQTIALI